MSTSLSTTTTGSSQWVEDYTHEHDYTNHQHDHTIHVSPHETTTTAPYYTWTSDSNEYAEIQRQLNELNAKYERLIRAIEKTGLRIDFEF